MKRIKNLFLAALVGLCSCRSNEGRPRRRAIRSYRRPRRLESQRICLAGECRRLPTNQYPRQAVTAFQATSIDRLHGHVGFPFGDHNSQIVVRLGQERCSSVKKSSSSFDDLMHFRTKVMIEISSEQIWLQRKVTFAEQFHDFLTTPTGVGKMPTRSCPR